MLCNRFFNVDTKIIRIHEIDIAQDLCENRWSFITFDVIETEKERVINSATIERTQQL